LALESVSQNLDVVPGQKAGQGAGAGGESHAAVSRHAPHGADQQGHFIPASLGLDHDRGVDVLVGVVVVFAHEKFVPDQAFSRPGSHFPDFPVNGPQQDFRARPGIEGGTAFPAGEGTRGQARAGQEHGGRSS
jgi:hypothetical protein